MTGYFLPPSPTAARLRLLATTDLHAHLVGYDYYADKPSYDTGLSRVATLIKTARAEAHDLGAATLLVDNGDGFQGAPLGESILHGQVRRHPLMTAFDVMGYDVMGLGNHDFNYGLPTLERLLRSAPCPAVCSNMTAIEPGLSLPFLQSALIEKQLPGHEDAPALRIGILSVLPPQTVIWDAYFLEGRVVVQDMVHAARDTAQSLRNQGADLIVALAHTGVSGRDTVLNMENALVPLAQIREIDALVAGHTHLTLPDASATFDRPVVMPGAFGNNLGLIDLSLTKLNGQWRVQSATPSLRPVIAPVASGHDRKQSAVPEDPALRAALEEDHLETCARLDQPVGRVNRPLHSYFSFIANDQSLLISACAQAAAVRAFMQNTQPRNLPLLSAAAPGKFGARAGPNFYTDVPAGQVTMRHVTDLQIFPNQLRAVEVTGIELSDWLEMSVGVFNRITPGSTDQPLCDVNRAGHNYDVIFGIEYEIDLSQPARFNGTGTLVNPAAKRICNLRWNGAPIRADQRFLVAVNSYRASGGGHFNMLRYAPQVNLPQVRLRDVLRDYIAGHLDLDPLENAPQPWSFRPQPETQVLALTGPASVPYLSDLDPDRVSTLPIDANGFLPLRITL